MAHFAKLGIDNIVLNVVVVDDKDTSTIGGIEKEDLGLDFLERLTGHANWKKCSFNTIEGVHVTGKTPLRVHYPSVGWYYDSTNDIFHPPRPVDNDGTSCASWTLDIKTARWNPPITIPTITDEQDQAGKYYTWNESEYQADNTKGWILTSST